MKRLFVLILLSIIVAAAAKRPHQIEHLGSISGQIIDENNKSVPGCSVRLKGTYLGGCADRRGQYYIRNITPGIYAVEALTVGYYIATAESVLVIADSVTIQNFQLKYSNAKIMN